MYGLGKCLPSYLINLIVLLDGLFLRSRPAGVFNTTKTIYISLSSTNLFIELSVGTIQTTFKLTVTKIAIERAIADNSGIIGEGYEGKRYSTRPKIANSKWVDYEWSKY